MGQMSYEPPGQAASKGSTHTPPQPTEAKNTSDYITEWMAALKCPARDEGINHQDRGARLSALADMLNRKPPEQYLLDAVGRQDPTVSAVSMDEVKTISVSPGQKHTLFTFGLCGCTAALLVSQKPDGSSIATMTHYGPVSQSLHQLAMQQEVMQHHKDLPEGTKHSLVVVSPRDLVQLGKCWSSALRDRSVVDSLTATAKGALGSANVEIKVCPYSEQRERGKSTGFIVEFTPTASNPAGYRAVDEHAGRLPLNPVK